MYENFIAMTKIWTLKWLESLIFFFGTNLVILKSSNVCDMNMFGFSYQFVHLKLLANNIKDQVF